MDIKTIIEKTENRFTIEVDGKAYTFRGVKVDRSRSDWNCEIICETHKCPMNPRKGLRCMDMKSPIPFRYDSSGVLTGECGVSKPSSSDLEFTDFCQAISDADLQEETSLKDLPELEELKNYLKRHPELEFLPVKDYNNND